VRRGIYRQGEGVLVAEAPVANEKQHAKSATETAIGKGGAWNSRGPGVCSASNWLWTGRWVEPDRVVVDRIPGA